MPTYAYRCKSCGHEFERTTPADAVKCQQDECPGWARRLWLVNINRQNLKDARS